MGKTFFIFKIKGKILENVKNFSNWGGAIWALENWRRKRFSTRRERILVRFIRWNFEDKYKV